MGEVWRATDTKLHRDVAIKVLPAEVAGDAARLARFQREAQLLASLNHPNIAAIHGLEEADGKPFLVLELVPGEDLAERLKRGPLPVDEAIEVARQVAEALEEAHERGVVHRDLKPANVKLTPDGKVKVLDFGLAKAWGGEPASGSAPDLSQSPTLAHTGTAAGMILGTAAYMSPEQARGKTVDKRADVWAFGALLHELLAGRPLFTGETVSDVLAAVLTREPDWAALPAATPASVAGCCGAAWSGTRGGACATWVRHASRSLRRPKGPRPSKSRGSGPGPRAGRRRRGSCLWPRRRRLSRSPPGTPRAGRSPSRLPRWTPTRPSGSSRSSRGWKRSPRSRPTATTWPTPATTRARSTWW